MDHIYGTGPFSPASLGKILVSLLINIILIFNTEKPALNAFIAMDLRAEKDHSEQTC